LAKEKLYRRFNPLNAKLNPTCHFLALIGAHPILHVSRISVKKSGGQEETCLTKWRLKRTKKMDNKEGS
jgi:hypothetical protein